ncbi:hypothetical protein CTRG_02593 [Candida tropicalis MYA-3404]|uniref:Zn(2)-C6 fungal-type domain-containing protein n=1 Tax=Candida tropicalis (strain ATCC MYA-3404 / T1) TaxID=294747 RepID=C5M871_CANTT|nr:hypothetical protein CTRG_02593 [Candida tropicalis MYA-3404]EER33775.1 hypothetical protein CTRG_02593 [Candida tropicalis MYA-3404]KAG4407623.1 hypothetical protein JTP64_003158 [Candida tropicalis]
MAKKSKQPNESTVSSNFKLISTSSGVRVSQACDRCRIKKIKCDGQSPCHNCKKVEVECKTSDKLSRKSFPKGFTSFLEARVKELEDENQKLRDKIGSTSGGGGHTDNDDSLASSAIHTGQTTPTRPMTNNSSIPTTTTTNDKVLFQSNNQSVPINNPIDQIFNIDNKGVIIGNDNLNFESQFNHLLINLNLPFLKITNSHNYLLNDPDSYLYNPSYTKSNKFHNRDLDLIYNPLTGTNTDISMKSELPTDIYDLFIKLINNFKKIFKNKKEMDNQIVQFFLNYNVFIPIFDFKQFMESYEAFHTMYPFMFTYDDSSINGFNLSNTNDYQIVNSYLMTIIQIYAMIMINNPTVNLNLLLNHSDPHYSMNNREKSIIKSLYDFLPYFNGFHISIGQLQTYLLLLYYSLLTNNKEKSLVLSSLTNAFIGILGINLNSKNLFFNDLALNQQQRRNRVKIFWVFKVLLKCFNLKFGFKPSLNTTVINPVTIDRYFQLTPEKLSSLLGDDDDLFNTLLKPSIEFLNLMNIIIPSSFSPNYYQYLKQDRKKKEKDLHTSPHRLDMILNEDDGDGNDGNLNYNYSQFLTIDKNLTDWRESLKSKKMSLLPLKDLGLPDLINITENDLHFAMDKDALSREGLINYYQTGLPDIHTASQLIKLQLNFHYTLIRSANYLNFIVDRELTFEYYKKIYVLSSEVLQYFLLVFEHVSKSQEKLNSPRVASNSIVMESLGLDVDDDGFVINDFSVKRRKIGSTKTPNNIKKLVREVPISPFNTMLNGLSLTVINLKKSIILQMLYLLICQMKFVKTQEERSKINDSFDLLSQTVDLFIKLFINYKPGAKSMQNDKLFQKLMNDELKEDILFHHQYGSDDEGDEDGKYYKTIDWDDENLDEDLKYLKILKFIKYKSRDVVDQLNNKQTVSGIPEPSVVIHHHHHSHNHNHKNSHLKQEENQQHPQPMTHQQYQLQHQQQPPAPPAPVPPQSQPQQQPKRLSSHETPALPSSTSPSLNSRMMSTSTMPLSAATSPMSTGPSLGLQNLNKPTSLPLPQYYNPYQSMSPVFDNDDKDAVNDLMNLRRGSNIK